MNNELTSEATDLHVDVLSTAPLVVGVSGEIDLASAPKLREELTGALRRHGARLALDLGDVTFIDCAGVNALLAARRHARLEGGWVRVARASRRARDILMLTGLQREFAADLDVVLVDVAVAVEYTAGRQVRTYEPRSLHSDISGGRHDRVLFAVIYTTNNTR
jgi:anti-sigma B factor antagonist